MKKFLLALLFLGAVFVGRSQVILNEIFSSSAGTNQFVELYNVGNDQVDLSCYRIISFGIGNGNPQRVTTINIIDFPDGALIPSKGYYTLGEAATILTKPMNYNWNAATQPTGASFRTFSVNNGNNTITGGSNTSGDFVLEATGNTKMAIFLFDGSSKDASSNITYVNGLVAFGSLTSPVPSPALPGIPNSFNLANFPVLDVTGATCGTSKIDWKKLVTSEYSEAASGTNHGYERLANGLCGTWQKITSGYTPNSRNRLGTTATSTSGTITASETAICNGVAYTVTGYPDAQFPLTLQLYYDDGDGILEDNEEKEVIATINTIPPSGVSGQFTYVTPLPAGSVPVIAYKTPFGCFARVFRATNTATLTTSQYTICNKQLGASITAADAITTAFGFPVTVNFLNNGVNIGTTTINSPSNTIYYSNISPVAFVDPTKLSVQYVPANCQSVSTATPATATFTTATGILQTTEGLAPTNYSNGNLYPARYQARVTDITSTTGFNEANTVPVTANLYYDNDPTITTDDQLIETFTFTSFSQTYHVFNHVFTYPRDKNSRLRITYTPAIGCNSQSKEFDFAGVQAPLPVHFTTFNASRKGDKVALNWETASELNNKGFYIQRRTNGDWKDVGFVFSQAQAGNSSAGLAYSFTDVNSHKGVSQYRILQVDLDGSGHYSDLRSVQGGTASGKMLLFPNPSATGTVTLVFDGEGTRQVVVTDVAGRIVQQHRAVTNGSLPITGLANGFYTVRVTDAATGTATVEKFIIKKR